MTGRALAWEPSDDIFMDGDDTFMESMEAFEILNLRRLEAFERLRDEVAKENQLWDRFFGGNDMLATVEKIVRQKSIAEQHMMTTRMPIRQCAMLTFSGEGTRASRL